MKLLTFKINDEENAMLYALQCWNDEQFQKWLNSDLGTINKDYEMNMVDWKNTVRMNQMFNDELEARGMNNRRYHTYNAEERDWYDNHPGRSIRLKPKSYTSHIRDFNTGIELDHWFTEYYTPQQLIDLGYINVVEVNDDFAKIFNDNQLYSFATCNIFDMSDEEQKYRDFRIRANQPR